MKYEVFSKLESAAIDNRTCYLAIRAAERETQEIIAAIDNRLTAEREQANSRTAELETQLADPERSETVRHMARLELDKLRGQSYAPTPEEKAAFEASVAELETALQDAIKVREDLTDLLREAKETLDKIRHERYEKMDLDIAKRAPDSLRESYQQMIRRACSK